MDKIRNSTANNILASELLARVFLKDTYILSRGELYSPPECYPKEEVSIYNIEYSIGNHGERTLYLIEVGSKEKTYSSTSYIDEKDNKDKHVFSNKKERINAMLDSLLFFKELWRMFFVPLTALIIIIIFILIYYSF